MKAQDQLDASPDLGEIMRRFGGAYSARHALFVEQRRAMAAIANCRTAALGGHLRACASCGAEEQSYNSCRDRHCPKCGGIRMRKWLLEQLDNLLPVPYFHSVFTVPSSLNPLVARNERIFYNTLFQAATDTLKTLAARHWDAEPGIVAALHTWGQTMTLHPHVHCIVAGGGLTADGRWIPASESFLFDVHECSAEFQRRFCRLLRRRRDKLVFAGAAAKYADPEAFLELLAAEERRDWVVYTQPPAAGEAAVLRYLSRYVHRVAISNNRILSLADDGAVTFAYKDYARIDADGAPVHKQMTLSADAFIGRFLRHVLPENFRRIRGYGFLAPARKTARLEAARTALGAAPPDPVAILDSLDPPTTHRGCTSCGHETFLPPQEIPPDPAAAFRPQRQQKTRAVHHSGKQRQNDSENRRKGPRIPDPAAVPRLSNGKKRAISRHLNLL